MIQPDPLNQTLILKDGRTFGYAECGAPAGKPLFHFHAAGSSRLERPWEESILTELGIRFISTDRPGHGLSDPQPGRKLLDWPGDIVQLAAHLGIDQFYVSGWSAGGPYALACARSLPGRVLAGAIISGLAPRDRPHPYQGLPILNRVWMMAARRVPALAHRIRRFAYSAIMGDPDDACDTLLATFPPEDRQLIQTPDERSRFVREIQEGYRQGWEGPVQDDLVNAAPWGFRLEEIAVRIDIWQGELDRSVPLNQARYQHEKLPNSRLNIWPGQAHLALLTRWREVLAALVE